MPARKKPLPPKPAVTASETKLRAALQREVTRREKVERELRAQNQFVSAILDTVGALVAVVDREGRIVRFNRTCEQTLGFTFAEVEGLPFWDLLPIAGEVEPARLVFERLLAGRWPASYETYWYTRDGTRRSLIWSTTFLNDATGEVEYVIGTGVDVTEHRRAEQKAAALLDVVKDIGGTLDLDEILLRVERRLTHVLPCDAVLTFYWDATRRVSRMISQYGLPEDSVAAAQTFSFNPRESFAGPFTHGETVLVDKVEELDWFPAAGGAFRVHSLVVAPLEVRGRILGSLIALSTSRQPFDAGQRDLCEGAARHLALAIEAADLYRAQQDEARVFGVLARVAQELIASLDTPALLDRLCRLTTEVIECDYSHTWLWQPQEDAYMAVAAHGDPPEVWEGIRVFRLTRPMVAGLLERLDRDGIVNADLSHVQRSELEVAAVASGVTVGMQLALRRGGEIVGIHTLGFRRPHEPFTPQQERIGRGIAQLASLALENARLVDELARANRLKSEFVATMSHELRTPLHIIVGYNDLLLNGDFGGLRPQQADTLERMRRSSQQLLDLINTTLDLSRLDSGRLALELQDVQLGELLSDIAAETQELQERSQLRFRWEAAAAPRLRTDPLKLKVVIKNLVANAIKFTETGEIAVAARANGDAVEISVSDTGIGMGPEVVAVIFEPFRQADGSIARRYGGVGLGLYIVHRLLQLLGGTIAVESTPGRGSTFRIQIPLAGTLDPLA